MRVLHKFNLILAALTGGLIVLFALQNLSDLEVTFLFWTFQTKRYFLIMVTAVVGVLIGLATGYSLGHRHGFRTNRMHRDNAA
jgi:uncharacterized integral membrane protein